MNSVTAPCKNRLIILLLSFALCSVAGSWVQSSASRRGMVCQQTEQQYYFLSHSILLQQADKLYQELGLSDENLRIIENEITLRMYSPKMVHVPGRKVSQVADLIRDETDQLLQELKIHNPSKLLRQWAYAEAVCAWVRSHIQYYSDLANKPGSDPEWVRVANPQFVLNQQIPRAVCHGFSVIARDIARSCGESVGLRCEYVTGELRRFQQTKSAYHSWDGFGFTLSSGEIIWLPADVTVAQTTCEMELNRQFPLRTRGDALFPHTPDAAELFLAMHFVHHQGAGQIEHGDKQDQKKHQMTTLTLREWEEYDITSLQSLRRNYLHWEGEQYQRANTRQ